MIEKYNRQIGGYAPGDYNCECSNCGDLFAGDKRAVTCSACAYGWRIKELESAMQEFVNDATPIDETESILDDIVNEHIDKFNNILAAK